MADLEIGAGVELWLGWLRLVEAGSVFVLGRRRLESLTLSLGLQLQLIKMVDLVSVQWLCGSLGVKGGSYLGELADNLGLSR